jgi:succinate dehydrogenase (ubiquinone) cytochrome b560 subunit
LAASFAALPVVAKVLLKATMAFPFVFHSLNGLRHLSWDMLVGLNNKAVIQTGWTVVGLSAAATLWFAVGY